MDDFEAFRNKKLGKVKPSAEGGAADDFEAFRQKKLGEKRRVKTDADRFLYYEYKVEEDGKAEGLTSHRTKLNKFSEDEIPDIEGYASHISRSDLDPESIEKFAGKKLWGDDLAKVDPATVEKVKRISHGRKLHDLDPESIEKPKRLKRY